MSEGTIAVLTFTFLVALLYSSVGHGGASGYLALLSFLSWPPDRMAASALLLNLLAAAVAFHAFWRAGHFSWRLTRPFLITSLPAALLGGMIKISPALYERLLSGVLLFAAWRLWFRLDNSEKGTGCFLSPPFGICLILGLGIGFLSGMVGVGGGIFLSPVLVLSGWAGAKKTAATSAFFIWANSLSGLLGRMLRGGLALNAGIGLMVSAAFLGSLLGSYLGARRFSPLSVRRCLAVVLVMASMRLL